MATQRHPQRSSPTDLFVRANREWDSGNEELAFKMFSEAAANGDASAENSIGYFLDHGIGVRKDTSKALAWYRRAARHGDVSACSNIATSYKDAGRTRQARVWFAKALERGDMGAAVDLARLLFETGRKAQTAEAIRYLKAAARSRYISDEDKKEASELLKRLI